MNKLMGTKWFTFYTKVRPILSGLFLLAVLESFRLNLAIYTKIWWLTLSFAGAVAQFVLCILIAVKSGGDYPHFVRFTRKVLLFETIYTAYQQGVETYVRNFDMISALIVFFVISIVLYFIWYRLNVKYFEKRLLPQRDETSASLGDAPSSGFHEGETGTAGESGQILFCRKCGAKFIANSKFCSRCGTRVLEEESLT